MAAAAGRSAKPAQKGLASRRWAHTVFDAALKPVDLDRATAAA
jgi:hypothetical protein